MQTLIEFMSDLLGDAFERMGFDRAFGRVRVSDRPDLGQFQCIGALQAGKVARRNPREVAEAVVAEVRGQFGAASVAGPGFINLTLSDAMLTSRLEAARNSRDAGAVARPYRGTVILDFGGPNVAKPMHVGHLRSSIIGDCLQRLGRRLGYTVISDIHMGDFGLQMGQLIMELRRRRPDLLYFDPACEGPYPQDPPVTIEDLQEMYPAAAARCKEDEAALEEARLCTAELQAGRPGYVALWNHFISLSHRSLESDFARLGVHFDLWLGESSVQDRLPGLVERLKAQGLAYESQGALVVDVDEGGEVPPLMLVKGDGAYTYAATDLATIEDRVEKYNPDVILYVVDQRQHLHFEQVFSVARRTGIARCGLEHIGFGTVNGKDGKPFKTRAGGVMKLGDLIEMAEAEVAKRLDETGISREVDKELRQEIIEKVAVAAVKFADLANNRLSSYVFDLAKFTSFDGKTGPYLLYAAVRIKSLLEKAMAQGIEPGPILPPGNDEERNLMLAMAMLPDAVLDSWRGRTPHLLCDFAHNVAQEFHRFYQAWPVIREPDADRRRSRLGLASLTLAQLSVVFDILGLSIPRAM